MKIVIVFLLSYSAFSNFTGKWSAEGFYESDRTAGKCKEVFLQLKQTEDFFYILDGGYICGEIQAQYPPSRFKISGEDLFYQGSIVGSISNDEIRISYLEGVYNLSLKHNSEEILFDESWREGDDFLHIRSKMSPF